MLRIFRNGSTKAPRPHDLSEQDRLTDSQEGLSCMVEVSQTSQGSYSTVIPRSYRASAQLPQGLVSKWVELEAQWRNANEVGSQVAEKAYVQAYENLVIQEEEAVQENHNVQSNHTQNNYNKTGVESSSGERTQLINKNSEKTS